LVQHLALLLRLRIGALESRFFLEQRRLPLCHVSSSCNNAFCWLRQLLIERLHLQKSLHAMVFHTGSLRRSASTLLSSASSSLGLRT